MKRFGVLILVLLAMTVPLFGQQPRNTNFNTFVGAFAAPYLSGTGTAYVSYTAGSLYKGGTAVSITASSVGTLGASKTNCGAPTYSSCAIIYWTSGTALSATNSIATATAAGNIVVGFATTNGSSVVTGIIPASLSLAPTQPVFSDCTTGNCSGATQVYGAGLQVIVFSGATTAGVLSLTNLPFTSATSYKCFGSSTELGATTADGAMSALATSASAATIRITGNTGTQSVSGACIGY